MQSNKGPSGALALTVLCIAILMIVTVVVFAVVESSKAAPKVAIPVNHENAAARAIDQGDILKACRHLEKARAQHPNDRSLKLRHAKALMLRGRLADAGNLLRELIKEDETDAAPVSLMADLLQAAGELEQALGYAQRAVKLDSSNPVYLKKLALLQVKAGRTLDALATSRRSLEIDPDQEDLKILVAKLSKLPLGPQATPGPGGTHGMGAIPSAPGLPTVPDPHSMILDPTGRSGAKKPSLPGLPRYGR